MVAVGPRGVGGGVGGLTSSGGATDSSAGCALIGARDTRAHPWPQCDGGAMDTGAVLSRPLRKESR